MKAALGLVARIAIVLALATPSLPARAQQAFGDGSAVQAAEQLKPGEFLWVPEIAPQGPLLLIVNLTTQRAVLYRNGVPIAVSTVSTGRKGHRTPTGVFTVLQKQVEHYSSIYDNAPMPFMQRLTWQGVALHGGTLPGYPASHGCIRLPHDFAQLLYGVTSLGMTVIVTDAPAAPRLAPTAELLGTSVGSGAGEGAIDWHPELAPEGPVSIVVSGADRRVVVLRNGREIGSAPVAINGPVTGTTAYVLRVVDAEGQHWFKVVLPGEEGAPQPATGLDKRFEVDAVFRAAVAGIVAPGTTVVVTADSLHTGAPPVPLVEAAPR